MFKMAGIVDYLKKQSGPASTEIKFADEPTAFVGENKVAIVKDFDNFSALAEKLRSDYDFGHPLNVKLLPRGESRVSGPIVRLSKPFNELFVDFQVVFISADLFCNLIFMFLSYLFVLLQVITYIVYHYYYIVPYNCVLLS
ncbi:hypothetical protein JHK85_007134 [Glycine max]|uniref:protein disulfide-isomerase n=1 Tax=Glycine soja TaxID=3848 RepID=A0A0B2QL86_GLYSO|nr:hypothetical protein JHK85_007134 [Glycine max]KHN22166.1 Protein disulfide-isomerase [Glycine soja]